jgi:hypothetical protein
MTRRDDARRSHVNPIRPTTQILALVLASALAAEPVMAARSESDFWAKRQRSAALVASAVSPSLPTLFSTPAPAPAVPAKLPARWMGRTLPSEIRAILSALPAEAGLVRRLSLPAGGFRGRVVVQIQDVHQNQEAQRHIGDLISALAREGAVDAVALEGAFAPLDVSRAQAYPKRESLRIVADDMLAQNEVAGPLHRALLEERPWPMILGVDDRAAHGRNVEAYRASVGRVSEIKAVLARERITLAEARGRGVDSRLEAFDGQVQSWQEGRLGLGDYVTLLAKAAGDPSIHTRRYLSALAAERRLDFAAAERERRGLLEEMSRRANADQMRELLALAATFRAGGSQADFYGAMEDMGRRLRVDVSSSGAFRAYMAYVREADGIDAEALYADLARMESAVYEKWATNETSRRWVARTRHLRRVAKLLDFALTPEEWRDYRRNPGDFTEDLRGFEAFYESAEERDGHLSRNLSNALSVRGLSRAVLVAGGYHTPGVERRLTESGAAVITVAPRVTTVDVGAGSAYLTAFTREKTPLDRLFEGRQLFVAQAIDPAKTDVGIAARLEALADLPPGESFRRIVEIGRASCRERVS